jgi:hypothetical protein
MGNICYINTQEIEETVARQTIDTVVFPRP